MRSLIVTVIGIGMAGSALAADRALVRQVESGNAKYAAGEFSEALETYKLAETDCPECPELAYNQGLAFYRMRDFEKAHEKFNEALLTRDLKLEQRAKYNLGNVAYSQALERMSDPKEAVEHAQRAIAFYRDALQLDENDTQARANIEIAQLLIKQLLDQQEQEQDQQQDQQQSEQSEQCDNPQQGQSDKQPEDQKDPQPDESEGEQSDEQQQQQGQEDQEGQQEQQQQPQPSEASEGSEEPQEAQAQQYEQRELTREEAERLLQAVRDKEAQRREEEARQMRAKRVPVKRDW